MSSREGTFEHVVDVVTDPRTTFWIVCVGEVDLGITILCDDRARVIVLLLDPV
jgi:hypothetical protein